MTSAGRVIASGATTGNAVAARTLPQTGDDSGNEYVVLGLGLTAAAASMAYAFASRKRREDDDGEGLY
jgi:LPXTG-motif cell wall-anchored protein